MNEHWPQWKIDRRPILGIALMVRDPFYADPEGYLIGLIEKLIGLGAERIMISEPGHPPGGDKGPLRPIQQLDVRVIGQTRRKMLEGIPRRWPEVEFSVQLGSRVDTPKRMDRRWDHPLYTATLWRELFKWYELGYKTVFLESIAGPRPEGKVWAREVNDWLAANEPTRKLGSIVLPMNEQGHLEEDHACPVRWSLMRFLEGKIRRKHGTLESVKTREHETHVMVSLRNRDKIFGPRMKAYQEHGYVVSSANLLKPENISQIVRLHRAAP